MNTVSGRFRLSLRAEPRRALAAARATAVPAGVLAASVWVWLLLVWMTPVWHSAPRPGSLTAMTAESVDAIASLLCHQRPERSFERNGTRLAVCARCTGLYLGAASGLLAAAVARTGRLASARRYQWIAAVAAAPTMMTIIAEWSGAGGIGNVHRFVSAVPPGAVAGWMIGVAVGVMSRSSIGRVVLG